MTPVFYLAAIPQHPTLQEELPFLLLGFGLVMVVLLLLWGICALNGLIFSAWADRAKLAVPVPPAGGPAPGLAAATAQMITAPEIAVIAAAVEAVLAQPHRVVTISTTSDVQAWSVEGRRQHFGSHQVRR